jgi:hypothetical protein
MGMGTGMGPNGQPMGPEGMSGMQVPLPPPPLPSPNTHTYTYTHTHTHTHTYTHTYTRAHTHTTTRLHTSFHSPTHPPGTPRQPMHFYLGQHTLMVMGRLTEVLDGTMDATHFLLMGVMRMCERMGWAHMEVSSLWKGVTILTLLQAPRPYHQLAFQARVHTHHGMTHTRVRASTYAHRLPHTCATKRS